MSNVMVNQIELWPIDRLVPFDRNARTHTAQQIAQVAGEAAATRMAEAA